MAFVDIRLQYPHRDGYTYVSAGAQTFERFLKNKNYMNKRGTQYLLVYVLFSYTDCYETVL